MKVMIGTCLYMISKSPTFTHKIEIETGYIHVCHSTLFTSIYHCMGATTDIGTNRGGSKSKQDLLTGKKSMYYCIYMIRYGMKFYRYDSDNIRR